MENYSSVAMAIAMVAAFLLLAGGVKLMLDRQTRVRGVLMIVAGARSHHERDDLDSVGGLIGSVASRMSR